MELKDMEQVPEFTNHKYVIDMMDPKDWARHYNEGDEVVNDFILPRGPMQQDEFSDTVYHAGTEVGYHWHKKGVETFEIAAGSIDCIINGVHFIGQTGDIIHLPPYTSHRFIYREEGTIWRELFSEIDMSGGILEKNIVNHYYADFKEDPEFMAMYREGKTMGREAPVAESIPLVDHSQSYNCRTPEFSWKTYEGQGYTLKMKVGRWENNGCKEIWHVDAKKGLKVDFDYPHAGYEMLYIQHGKVKLTVDKTYESAEPQSWIVTGDHIIDVPPYHCYHLEFLEDTALYNYGGRHYLMNCLEDLASVEATKPETIADPKARLSFLRKYGVYATGIFYQEP